MRTTIKYDKSFDKSIDSSRDAAALLAKSYRRKDHEEVWILLVDNANHPLAKRLSTIGSLTEVNLDVRRIVKDALTFNATGVIVSHNHPSGNLTPSLTDVKMTEKLSDALKLFDIRLMDHLIIGKEKFYSCSDETLYNLS